MKYTFTDTRTNEESEIFDSFVKLKNYFEPDENELPEEWDKWEQIDDLYDLKEFLREFDNGVEFFEFKEIPEDIDILMADGCTKEEAKKNLKDGAIVFYDLEENLGKYLEEWAYLDDKDGFLVVFFCAFLLSVCYQLVIMLYMVLLSLCNQSVSKL
jgi:hypothetical protein